MKKLLALSISLIFSAAPAFAEGDISKGKAKATNCASCHGEDGNSAVASFPKLAGQHKNYLVKQLQALKGGNRNAPMMAPLAMGLSDTDINDLAAFYASKKISSNQLPILFSDDDDDDAEEKSTEELAQEVQDLLTLGKDLYRNGNLKSQVSACIACHGPSGEGNKPASFPTLRGQHSDYLIKTLTDFKNGTRSKDSSNMMHMIAKKMTDKEIQAVSYHISMKK